MNIVSAILMMLASSQGADRGLQVVNIYSVDKTPVKGVVVRLSHGSTPSTAEQITNEQGVAAFEKHSWTFERFDASLAPFDVRIRFYEKPPLPLKVKWPRMSFDKSEKPSVIKIVTSSGSPPKGAEVYDYTSPAKPKLITKISTNGLVELGDQFKNSQKLYISAGVIGMDVDLAKWVNRSQLLVVSMPEFESD